MDTDDKPGAVPWDDDDEQPIFGPSAAPGAEDGEDEDGVPRLLSADFDDDDAAEPERVFRLGPGTGAEEEGPGPAAGGSRLATSATRALSAEAPRPATRRPAAPRPAVPPRPAAGDRVPGAGGLGVGAPRPAAPPVDEDFGADDFEEEQPFAASEVQKLGIVGGKGVGKSYLFQAMVYRTYAGGKSGAMTYYLENDAIRLFSALERDDRARTLNLFKFIKKFVSWERLPQTLLQSQRWYRLHLPYRTGIFGTRRSAIDVEFFDGSGEGFFEAERSIKNRRLWREGYLEARVMVFCLPLWVAFPSSALSREDLEVRDLVLEGFEQVVQNYTDLRTLHRGREPVSSILALTMADDSRCALQTLQDRWIRPFLDSPNTHLRQLRTGKGISRYLSNARQVSEALFEEFIAAEPIVAAVPQKLDFGAGRPWMIPLSAIDGALLDSVQVTYPDPTQRPKMRPPVPVHVELPLLVALCERANALM